jgi:hypothetical protein
MNERHPPDHRLSGDGSAPNATDALEKGESTITDELTLLLKQFREFGEYFSYLVTAKTDSVKLSFRHFVLWVLLAALGFVALGGLIVIASWLLLSGIADGLGGLFGDRPWIGSLITGLLLLAGLGLGMYCAVARQSRIARERTAKKYERRKARQQAQFGQNVADRAAATISQNK